MIFHWKLSDSKSLQISFRNLISILVDLDSAMVRMVSILPLIISPNSFPCHWVSFQGYLARSKYLFLLSFSFIFTLWSAGMVKSTRWQDLLFLLIHTGFGLLASIEWSVRFSKSQRILCTSFPRTDAGLSNFNFLHNSLWITFSTQSYIVLYSFFC